MMEGSSCTPAPVRVPAANPTAVSPVPAVPAVPAAPAAPAAVDSAAVDSAAPPAALADPFVDWRSKFSPEARQRIVNRILLSLNMHLPIPVPEAVVDLRKFAVRFEEKIYTTATTQSEYLRKISPKLLTVDTRTRGAAAINPSLPNPTIGSPSPSESVNSTTQTGHAHTVPVNSTTQTVDWQEEVYQKVKSLKEIYHDEIRELQQRTNLKIQQLTQSNALLLPAKPFEQLEKLKQFVQMLECAQMFLETTKDNIRPFVKDNLPLIEKQMVSLAAINRVAKLQGQQFQYQPSRISTTSMQQGSTVPTTQPNIADALQPPSLDQIQGNSFSPLQPGAIGPMQSGGFGSLQNVYQPYSFNGFGSLQNYANANQQRSIELQLQVQRPLLEQQRQLHSIQQKQQVPVQMNGVSQGFGPGLHQPYFPGVSQQNYFQPLKPSGLFPSLSQQNLQTALPQSSAQVEKYSVGISLQPASSTIASPCFTPIASSPTEKHSATLKSVSTESQVVIGDRIAALENHMAVLKNRVVSLEKSLLVILCALFLAFLLVLISSDVLVVW